MQFFVTFHSKIFDECYEDIPQEMLDEYFTFVAVNKNIPKTYTSEKYNIINEWDLPIYDQSMQERGYNENSVLYHVFINKLHEKYSHVGFFQYDMKLSKQIIDMIIRNAGETSYFAANKLYDFSCLINGGASGENETYSFIIRDYEKYFNKEFNYSTMYPLFNTFVLPTSFYNIMMPWIIQLYEKTWSWCIEPPNRTHFGHVGGIYERVSAFVIGEHNWNNIHIIDLEHDHILKKISY